MLKWEHNVTEEQAQGCQGHFTRADRWIILIFYLMGLSIGVHLLNLLTIPGHCDHLLLQRYKASGWGTIAAFVIGCLITGLVQSRDQWSIKGAGNMDIFLSMISACFYTGFAFFFVLPPSLSGLACG